MAIEDLRQYWQELASKAGIPEDQANAVAEALGNEAVARTFKQGFVPVPDHHSTLDQMKNKTASREAELNQWYERVALPAYQTNLAGIERLRQYESLYGDVTSGTSPTSTGSAMTQEQMDRYLEEKLRARDQATVGLTKAMSRMTIDYYKRFGEQLDADEVERIAVQNGLPPLQAYEKYIEPKLEVLRKKELDDKVKAAREEGFRDAVSKYRLPVDSTPKEANPFFDRKEAPKGQTPIDEDRASRSAFLDGWQSYAEELKPRS